MPILHKVRGAQHPAGGQEVHVSKIILQIHRYALWHVNTFHYFVTGVNYSSDGDRLVCESSLLLQISSKVMSSSIDHTNRINVRCTDFVARARKDPNLYLTEFQYC